MALEAHIRGAHRANVIESSLLPGGRCVAQRIIKGTAQQMYVKVDKSRLDILFFFFQLRASAILSVVELTTIDMEAAGQSSRKNIFSYVIYLKLTARSFVTFSLAEFMLMFGDSSAISSSSTEFH